jgi:hypothetical protein
MANALDRMDAKHAPRLSDHNDRAYEALLSDLLEPNETQPGLADLQGESRQTAAALDDAGDRFAFDTTVSPYEGE